MTIKSWAASGNHNIVLGKSIFYIDSNNGKTPICILHGYPSCSFDYHASLPLLEERFRVIVHDHPGFGLSEKPLNYSYSLIEQADLALALWQKLGLKEVHILAHNYGTSVATEIIARESLGNLPVKITTVTLSNGSMLIEMANLRLIQLFLRNKFFGPIAAKLSSKFIFKINMKNLWADKTKINEAELDILWQMLTRKNGRKVLPKITQYLHERRFFHQRWIGALEKTALNISIVWAEDDPVAVVKMAYALEEKIKNSHLQILQHLGHYPMLENPEQWCAAVVNGINYFD